MESSIDRLVPHVRVIPEVPEVSMMHPVQYISANPLKCGGACGFARAGVTRVSELASLMGPVPSARSRPLDRVAGGDGDLRVEAAVEHGE